MSHLTFDDATEVRANALQSGSLVFFFSVLCPSSFSCLAFTSPLPESVPEQMPAHIRTYPGASSVPDAELMQSRRCGGLCLHHPPGQQRSARLDGGRLQLLMSDTP